MKAFLALLFLSFVYLSEAQISYEYSSTQLNGTQCVPIPMSSCSYCAGLYYNPTAPNGNLEVNVYYDARCTQFYANERTYNEDCTLEKTFLDCSIFYQPVALNGYELTLSSTSPIKVEYYGEILIASTLSQDKITASGNIEGLVIQSLGGYPNFRFEQRLTSTLYSTTLGVFTFGETYTANSYTFSVSLSSIPIPPPITTQNIVTLSAFIGAWVENGNEYYNINMLDVGALVVAADDLDFEGLVLSGPYITITNMTVFAPYLETSTANIVFQFYSNSSPYFSYDCEYAAGSTYNSYECNLESISFRGAFSLDETNNAQARNADEMSFSLF